MDKQRAIPSIGSAPRLAEDGPAKRRVIDGRKALKSATPSFPPGAGRSFLGRLFPSTDNRFTLPASRRRQTAQGWRVRNPGSQGIRPPQEKLNDYKPLGRSASRRDRSPQIRQGRPRRFFVGGARRDFVLRAPRFFHRRGNP